MATVVALYPFQAFGVRWLRDHRAGLLWDEPGLGKTAQALFALGEGDAVVALCPSVVKHNWAREAMTWAPHLRVEVLEGRQKTLVAEPGVMKVLNPEILPEHRSLVGTGTKPRLVVDEAHMYKNPKAQRTKTMRRWAHAFLGNGGSCWQLTGTPLLNRPPDLWNLLQNVSLGPSVFGSYDEFVRLFEGRLNHWGGMDWGYPHPSVPGLLRPFALRRTRQEVLPELPTKTYDRVVVHVPAPKAVDECLASLGEDWVSKVEQLHDPEVSSKFSTLRRLLAECKVPELQRLLDLYEEEGDPVVVFSDHRSPLLELARRPGWAVITGDTPARDRDSYAQRFQAGELSGIAGTIGAMGVGLTLTRARRVVFLDRATTPALNTQAEDRVCRIGQDRGVLVTDVVSDFVVDQLVHSLLAKKQVVHTMAIEDLPRFENTLGTSDATMADTFELPSGTPLLRDRPRPKWRPRR